MSRADVLDELAADLLARELGHPVRVGIDGSCGSGKTTFRRALADRLRDGPRPVVELDSDGFHNPRAIRYRRGRGSARGYYDDAYDLAAVERLVLRPLGPGGSRRVAVRLHDLSSDRSDLVMARVDVAAIVLFDCTFFQRGTLRESWDEVVYLDVEETIARERGIARDADALGGAELAAEIYDSRYIAACRLYRDEENPRAKASVLIENTDPQHPRLLHRGSRDERC